MRGASRAVYSLIKTHIHEVDDWNKEMAKKYEAEQMAGAKR